MGKSTHRQGSFAAGEVSPSFYGKTGSEQYAEGLRTCRNTIVNRYGSLERRVGTEFLAVLDNQSYTGNERPIRIIPFRFDADDQNYIIMLVDTKIYVFYDGVDVTGGGIVGFADTSIIWNLRYTQAGDTMFFASPATGPAKFTQKLVRTNHTTWALSNFIPYASATAPTWDDDGAGPGGADAWNAVAQDTVGATDYKPKRWSWKIAGVKDGIESKPSPELWPNNVAEQKIPLYPNFTDPGAFWWDDFSASADTIRIYRGRDGIWGLVAEVDSSIDTYIDGGDEPDYTQRPREATSFIDTLFADGGSSYAGWYAITFFEQRLIFANRNSTANGTHDGMRIYASKIGKFNNFEADLYPLVADQAIDISLASRVYERIMHMVPLRRLIILTDTGEWYLSGTGGGPLATDDYEARQYSQVGSSRVVPVVVDSSVIFVQREGKTIHALGYLRDRDGLDATDLIWASRHLTDGLTIVDMDYQRTPDSIVWCVLSDGAMAAMTFLPKYGVMAWHRHDTSGFRFADTTPTVEGPAIDSVAVIPENGIDTVYMVVRRQRFSISGGFQTSWYLERMPTQVKNSDPFLHTWLDSWVKHDYRNTTAADLMNLSGGSTWEDGETGLTLQAQGGYTPFTNGAAPTGDIGDHVWFDPNGVAGGPYKAEITAFTSTSEVTVTLRSDIPAAYRATAVADWAFARTTHTYHLKNNVVSTLVDGKPGGVGFVSDSGLATTTRGSCVILGIPITSQIEQLELGGKAEARTSMKTVSRVELEVDEAILPATGTASGIKVGDTLDGTLTSIGHDAEDEDGRIEVAGGAASRKGGRFAVQCTDAIPLIIRSITRGVAVDGSNLA